MSLRERMYEITEPHEIDEFLARFPTSVIFKAGSCHKTMQAFGHVEEALNHRDDMHLAFIRVIESRPASNHVTALTGIIHHSPQFILFLNGKPVYDVDNWNVTLEAVEGALDHHLGSVEKKKTFKGFRGNVGPYVDLLKLFINDEMSEQEFSSEWIMTFKYDPTPRSKEEFALLQGLYGNPDCSSTQTIGADGFKEKCRKILEQLETTPV